MRLPSFALFSALVLPLSCVTRASAPPSATTTTDAGADAAVAPDAAPRTIAFRVADYPGRAGKLLLATVAINGSAPVEVLIDTGSTGLRVFASSLKGVTFDKTSAATSAEFGGNVMKGLNATGKVSFGDVATPEPITFQLVESLECAASFPDCDVADGTAKSYTAAGIHGILGVGLRSEPSGLSSPFAQLGAPRAAGFVLSTGGPTSQVGTITFGPPDFAGFGTIALARAGSHANGAPAWADDDVEVCYEVDGAPTQPHCMGTVFDSGSNLDVLYAKGIPASARTNQGLLASGRSFGARRADAFDMKFSVGNSITPSWDAVLLQDDEPFTILGVQMFFRFDFAFDHEAGRIGLRPIAR